MSGYLVTGGAGFIGSHLVNLLLAQGHEVVVLDNLSTGLREKLPLNHIKFIQGDILDHAVLAEAFNNIAGCFHLAAVASVQKSINNWYYTHQVNLSGTINVFLEAVKQNIPVIYASSAAVYGDQNNLPLQETDEVKPLSPYAVDKYSCELQAKIFGQLKGLKSCGLRFFNIYGSGQLENSGYSGVISIFKQQVKDHKELTIFGDGRQSRDFIHISDVTKFCLQALSIASNSAPIFNVCTGKAHSLNDLTKIISRIFKIKGIKYLPTQIGNIEDSLGSPELAANIMGCRAEVNLQDGLSELFATELLQDK